MFTTNCHPISALQSFSFTKQNHRTRLESLNMKIAHLPTYYGNSAISSHWQFNTGRQLSVSQPSNKLLQTVLYLYSQLMATVHFNCTKFNIN